MFLLTRPQIKEEEECCDGASYETSRERSCSSEDWSDPRNIVNNIQDGGKGVEIPFFLQPLLGLDFVPYLPPSEVSSSPHAAASRQPAHYADSRESELRVETGVEISLGDHAELQSEPRNGLVKKSLGSAIRRAALRMKRIRRRPEEGEPRRRARRRTPKASSVDLAKLCFGSEGIQEAFDGVLAALTPLMECKFF